MISGLVFSERADRISIYAFRPMHVSRLGSARIPGDNPRTIEDLRWQALG